MRNWTVALHPDFLAEYRVLREDVQDSVLRLIRLLEATGPALKRPYADTLKGSRFSNMKELRITVPDGEWRVAYAFDPKRQAILLVAGDKSGTNERLFYRGFIRKADSRFYEHMKQLNTERD